MDVPNVSRTEYQFSHIEDDFLHLIKADGSEKNDVKVPDDEVGEKIREYEDVGTDICKFSISVLYQIPITDSNNFPHSNHHYRSHEGGGCHLRQRGPEIKVSPLSFIALWIRDLAFFLFWSFFFGSEGLFIGFSPTLIIGESGCEGE